MPDILPQTGVFNASVAQYTQSIQANPPGKIIVVDDADTGSHGIPDFARGVSGNPYMPPLLTAPFRGSLPFSVQIRKEPEAAWTFTIKGRSAPAERTPRLMGF
jgi:hypothetical protein